MRGDHLFHVVHRSLLFRQWSHHLSKQEVTNLNVRKR